MSDLSPEICQVLYYGLINYLRSELKQNRVPTEAGRAERDFAEKLLRRFRNFEEALIANPNYKIPWP